MLDDQTITEKAKRVSLLLYPNHAQVDLCELSADGTFTFPINVSVRNSQGFPLAHRTVYFVAPVALPDWLHIPPIIDKTDSNGMALIIVSGSLQLDKAQNQSFIYTLHTNHSTVQDMGIITFVGAR